MYFLILHHVQYHYVLLQILNFQFYLIHQLLQNQKILPNDHDGGWVGNEVGCWVVGLIVSSLVEEEVGSNVVCGVGLKLLVSIGAAIGHGI